MEWQTSKRLERIYRQMSDSKFGRPNQKYPYRHASANTCVRPDRRQMLPGMTTNTCKITGQVHLLLRHTAF